MREILFRGKDISFGDWIEGDLIRNDSRCYPAVFIGCIEASRNRYDELSVDGHYLPQVDPETVGQYTGLKDKNGKRIFEGDIVHVWWRGNSDDNDDLIKYKAIIEFGNPNYEFDWGWQLVMLDYFPFNKSILLWVDMEESDAYCEVIGNIHDNPELLEVER